MVLVGGGGAEGVVDGGGVMERAGAVCFWSMRKNRYRLKQVVM